MSHDYRNDYLRMTGDIAEGDLDSLARLSICPDCDSTRVVVTYDTGECDHCGAAYLWLHELLAEYFDHSRARIDVADSTAGATLERIHARNAEHCTLCGGAVVVALALSLMVP